MREALRRSFVETQLQFLPSQGSPSCCCPQGSSSPQLSKSYHPVDQPVTQSKRSGYADEPPKTASFLIWSSIRICTPLTPNTNKCPRDMEVESHLLHVVKSEPLRPCNAYFGSYAIRQIKNWLWMKVEAENAGVSRNKKVRSMLTNGLAKRWDHQSPRATKRTPLESP